MLRVMTARCRMYRMAVLCLVGGMCLSLAAGCTREGDGTTIKVVTSTTMLEAIVKEVGGDRVTVAALIPAEMPPDKFHLSAENLDVIAASSLFVYTGWERWVPEIALGGDRPVHIVGVHISGDLMLPYYHLEAADSVTEALVRIDPGGEVFYRYNRTDYRSRIGIEAEDACAYMYGLAGARVICAEPQAEFLDWMGFDLVGTYDRPEETPPGEADRLIEVGRRHGVLLVVDDLHTGGDMGRRIAEGIGASRVVLTRYPAHGSYTELLRSNAATLTSALK